MRTAVFSDRIPSFLSHCTDSLVPALLCSGTSVEAVSCSHVMETLLVVGNSNVKHLLGARSGRFLSLYPFTFRLCRWNTMFTDNFAADMKISGPLIQVLCLESRAIATLRLLNRVPRSKQQSPACHETLMALFEIYGSGLGLPVVCF